MVDSDAAQLIFLEDLNEEMDKKFTKLILQPHLKAIFTDLSLRSSQPPKDSKIQKSIDKVTFVEYINLPGILSDRFYSLATLGSQDTRITEEIFQHLLLHVYRASLEQKMELAFSM